MGGLVDDGRHAEIAPGTAAAAHDPADSPSGDFTLGADTGETDEAGDINMGYIGSHEPQADVFPSEPFLMSQQCFEHRKY